VTKAGSHLFFFLTLMLTANPRALQTAADSGLPHFGRDTVLVYRSSNEKEGPLIVRIATFLPDRYIEWEDTTTQGTIFMPAKIVSEGRGLVNYQLFQAGVDTRGKDATTLWLSQRILRELRASKKVKFMVDGIPAAVTVLGFDQLTVEVNKSPVALPVIKTKDDRGAERWFLNEEENPLLVNLLVRDYQQKLASITTDRVNTLRWIKDKKK
jgi:hypothetical protein